MPSVSGGRVGIFSTLFSADQQLDGENEGEAQTVKLVDTQAWFLRQRLVMSRGYDLAGVNESRLHHSGHVFLVGFAGPT